MKIILPGGGGHLGTLLAQAFHGQGHEVVVLSRKPSQSAPWRVVGWDGESLGSWAAEFDGADAVINLAGRSVNCRYGPKNRADILQSRLVSTRLVGEAIARAAKPPRVWLQSSTATIYAHRYDAANDEATGTLGCPDPNTPETWEFSYKVAWGWERMCTEAPTPHTRKVLMRTSIVLSPMRGQAFDILLTLVKFGLGGRAGDGRQYVSWLHDRDFVRAVQWLMEHEELSGPVNLASPNPLPNADFMRELRKAAHIPLGLPAEKWMIEIGSFFLRTESELVLKSRRVAPGRLLASGFQFDFPTWPVAARDLVSRR
ncbi:MAG TPA: TIGR01777 family oxidoreductase [Opitutales bacterium]|nr:TIGR01777 family oxidoreductase [Opitutales bacterium]